MCLTRNRRQWLPKAIACYQKQSYPKALRELLILSDGEGVRDLIPADKSIRLIHLDRQIEVGEKRNLGCEWGRGDVIVHFDDDDHSAPGRITDQVNRLLASGLSITGYHSMRFTDGAHWWMYSGGANYALGTSLCYWFDWWETHPFPAINVAEDNAFVGAAAAAKQIATEDAGDLMHATIHGGNVSPRQLGAANWRRV